MSIVSKIISFIKNIFKKQEIKTLEEPKQIMNEDTRANFIQSIKVEKKRKKGKVETIICEGNGLGIQGKLSS